MALTGNMHLTKGQPVTSGKIRGIPDEAMADKITKAKAKVNFLASLGPVIMSVTYNSTG